MKVIKAGILDSFQDMGRKGFAQIGISEGGFMDKVAASIANWLVGNNKDEAVLEMHYPAPVLFFLQPVEMAIAGADFGGTVGGIGIPNLRRVVLPAKSTLSFTANNQGQRAYLAVKGGWDIPLVLGSKSTHLQAGFGGWKGRALQPEDNIPEKCTMPFNGKIPFIEKWFPKPFPDYSMGRVRCMPGPEWDWLSIETQYGLMNSTYRVSSKSNRMGSFLEGPPVSLAASKELISSAVIPGTIQLLPNGQMMVLMADAQTTGGYPRVLQVAEVDIPVLSQQAPGAMFNFEMIGVEKAIDLLNRHNIYISGLQSSIDLARKKML
jgi:antagonist of KipI